MSLIICGKRVRLFSIYTNSPIRILPSRCGELPVLRREGGGRMSGGKTYVLMVTTSKVIAPMLAPATGQGAIDAMCSFEVIPAAVSHDH